MHANGKNGDRQCWRCEAHVGPVLVCPQCEAPQPVPPGADLFALLGLPRHLTVDRDDLERRWHAASRALHPDRHQTAGARDRELSLAASAAINEAHRTLRDPIARGRYWLELHGNPLGERNNQVPPALAAFVFETQEELEALRESPRESAVRARVEGVRRDVAEKVQALQSSLVERYGAWADAESPATLDELKRGLSEIAYLGTLLDDVETALEG
jgi:molecular chaperone HscB